MLSDWKGRNHSGDSRLTQPGPRARYSLDVGTDLEDLAGNAVGRPFEVNLAGPISARVKAEVISRPFRIEPGRR